jgi:hypothetical protein
MKEEEGVESVLLIDVFGFLVMLNFTIKLVPDKFHYQIDPCIRVR